jgi:hypothetical protein
VVTDKDSFGGVETEIIIQQGRKVNRSFNSPFGINTSPGE